MTGVPFREPPTGTKRHYAKPPEDMTDEEIDEWAERFVDAILGATVERENDSK